jgi:hypothetical protein
MTSSQYYIIPITRARKVLKECGPMITGILRKFSKFANTYPHIYFF